MSDLSRDEFLLHIGLVRADVAAVQHRLDTLNGRTRDCEQAIAITGQRCIGCASRLEALEAIPKPTMGRVGVVSGGVGAGVVVGMIEAVKAYFK